MAAFLFIIFDPVKLSPMKGRFLLAVLVVFVVAQSCSRGEGARPEIKKDQLVDMLVDIHLTDGYLSFSGARPDRDRERIIESYTYILQKYDITPRQFHNTMIYYSRHIDDYEQIYNKVIEKLTIYEAEAMKDNSNTPNRPDKPLPEHPRKAKQAKQQQGKGNAN